MTTRKHALGLAALCATMGILHLRLPQPFDGLIPAALPGKPRDWTYASGVAELGVAALLAAPATRKLGGRAAQVLFVGVFPGNLQMVWNWRHRPWPLKAIGLARLPLQVHLIKRAGEVARG